MDDRRSLHELVDRVAPDRLAELRELLHRYVTTEPPRLDPTPAEDDANTGHEFLREEC